MKKILLLLSVAFLAFSCSEDEESDITGTSESALVGTWTLVSQIDNGEVLNLETCAEMNQIVFDEDEAISTFFRDLDGECIIEETDNENYTATATTITFDDEIVNNYTINGNELTLIDETNYEGEIDVFTEIYEKQ